MFRILLVCLLLIIAGCAQDSSKDMAVSERINYTLLTHTGLDTLPVDDISIFFDGEQFSGKGPINRFFGRMSDNQILPPIGSTMMAGPDHLMQYEQQFFADLDSSHVQGIGSDTLKLVRDGVVRFVFIRTR